MKRLISFTTAFALLFAQAAVAQPSPPPSVPKSGGAYTGAVDAPRFTFANNPTIADNSVSTMDSIVAKQKVFGDESEFDAVACYGDGNVNQCQTAATSTAFNGNTLTVDHLPPYIGATGILAIGVGLTGTPTVTGFSGVAGGPGAVTLSSNPTGVGAIHFAPPANVIQFTESGSISTTVTTIAGSNTVTFGTGFCTAEMVGSQIRIPGAGLNGADFNTIISGCQNVAVGSPSAVIGTTDQVGTSLNAVTKTVTYGANFATACKTGNFGATGLSGCVGMGMLAESWNGTGGGGVSAIPVVINTVYSPSVIAVSVNGTQVAAAATKHFVTGHDDSVAVNNICQAGSASHYRYLIVPTAHYVPSLTQACKQFLIRGAGKLVTTANMRNFVVAGSLPPTRDPVVVPFTAPQPTGPRVAVTPSSLRLFRSTLTPQISSTYDSLSAPEANQISDTGTYPFALMSAIKRQNPGLAPSIVYPGISGGTLVGVIEGTPTVANLPCVTNTTTPWLTQVVANCPNTTLWTIGGATNDSTGMNSFDLLSVMLKLRGGGYGSFFSRPRDLIYYTNHPQTRINQGANGNSAIEDASEYSAGVLCSFAEVMGFPCIDGEAEGQKHIWGYDPRVMGAERAFDVPYNTNNLGLPFAYGRAVYGYGMNINSVGSLTPANFWAQLTGNGGATDPRGAFLEFDITPNSGSGFGRVWLFYNSASGTVGIECDANDKMLGIGCVDPATGNPPVTAANLHDAVTVANSGAGGVAVVTLATQHFVWKGADVSASNCPTGQTVTIPGAGASITPPGHAAYTAPDIDTVASCQSATQMTLTNAAPHPISAVNEFVFYGNPVITSGNIVDSGNPNIGGAETIHFEVVGSDLVVWIGTQRNILYSGKIMRPRSLFQPGMFSGGNRPTINIAGDLTTGNTTFTVSKIMPNVTDFTDNEVVGPSGVTPYSNAIYMSLESGDGYAHNSTRYGSDVIVPLYAAQNFSLGNGGVSVDVTGNYTVPNCLVGRVNVNSASAATITVPQFCPSDIKVIDAGGHGSTATITVAAPTGLTLSGTATITTNFGNRTISYSGTAATVN